MYAPVDITKRLISWGFDAFIQFYILSSAVKVALFVFGVSEMVMRIRCVLMISLWWRKSFERLKLKDGSFSYIFHVVHEVDKCFSWEGCAHFWFFESKTHECASLKTFHLRCDLLGRPRWQLAVQTWTLRLVALRYELSIVQGAITGFLDNHFLNYQCPWTNVSKATVLR